jgi:hypothetical protein
MQLLVDVFYSLLLYCFTFFGERGEVPIGLLFSAGVPKKVHRSNFCWGTALPGGRLFKHTVD